MRFPQQTHSACRRLPVREKIVDNQHMILFGNKTAGEREFIAVSLCERGDDRLIQMVVQNARGLLFQDYHRDSQGERRHQRRSDAGALDCDHLCDAAVPEMLRKGVTHLFHKNRICLVIDKTVHPQDLPADSAAFRENFFFKYFHHNLHSGAFMRRGGANPGSASAISRICDAPAQIRV